MNRYCLGTEWTIYRTKKSQKILLSKKLTCHTLRDNFFRSKYNFFYMGHSRPLFCLFSLFSRNNFNTNWKKLRWCAWDSNPGPQDGRRRRNHGAMAATLSKYNFFTEKMLSSNKNKTNSIDRYSVVCLLKFRKHDSNPWSGTQPFTYHRFAFTWAFYNFCFFKSLQLQKHSTKFSAKVSQKLANDEFLIWRWKQPVCLKNFTKSGHTLTFKICEL